MAWPTASIPTTNLDSDGDSPKLARADLLAAVQALNQMIQAGGVPTGVVQPFAGSTSPTGWLLCAGQAVSRSTYADLFGAIGTTYGAGDGTTTFNLPDLRGRVVAGKDDMGGTAANRLQVSATISTTASSTSATVGSAAGLAIGMKITAAGVTAGTTITAISGTTITLSAAATAAGTGVAARFSLLSDAQTAGATGGTQTHLQVAAEMPAHTHTITALSSRNTSSGGSETIADTSSNTTMATASAGGDLAHPNVQPTLVMNFIIKT